MPRKTKNVKGNSELYYAFVFTVDMQYLFDQYRYGLLKKLPVLFVQIRHKSNSPEILLGSLNVDDWIKWIVRKDHFTCSNIWRH
jgi:hypothetical protein